MNSGRPESGMTRVSGFTLIELMAVAVLIALLAGAGMVSYSKSSAGWQLKDKARQLYLAAKFARVKAIEKQRPCSLILDKTNGCFHVELMVDEADEVFEQPTYSWFSPKMLGEGIEIEKYVQGTTTYGGEQGESELLPGITFEPDGSGMDAMVQLGQGNRHFTVTVSAATGRVRFYEQELEQFTLPCSRLAAVKPRMNPPRTTRSPGCTVAPSSERKALQGARPRSRRWRAVRG